MTEFKVNDRVKIIVPTDEEKATLQANYFDAWQSSPIDKYGRAIEEDSRNTSIGHWITVELDSPVLSPSGVQYSIMAFPEWELEKVLTLDKDDE